MREFESSADLVPLIGTEVAVSEWVTIDQRVIDLFADATDDHQWIHVDPARAADSPFGSTVAHGFLTLSLLPKFLAASVRFKRSCHHGLRGVAAEWVRLTPTRCSREQPIRRRKPAWASPHAQQSSAR